MNPTVIKVGIGVVCTAVVILYTFWKNYQSQRSQQAAEESPNFNEESVSICCICLTEFDNFPNKKDVFSLPCKHRFHRACIMTLFFRENHRKSCPLCRRLVGDDYLRNRL